jgi:lipopolysaccharide biosynthesis regulator YciM
MDTTTLAIIIGALFVAFLASLLLFRRQRASTADQVASDYAAALNYLVIGKRQEALEKLREAVRRDTGLIDAYIKIGDIYRDLGKVQRAIQVHRDLTVRSHLTLSQQQEILRSLAQDYEAAEQYDKATAVLDRLLELDREDLWAREMKLRVFEKMEDWERAFTAYQELLKGSGKKRNGRLALYKVEDGRKLIREGKEKEGRIRFREALRIDPTCAAAYIYLSDSYIRDNRRREALDVLEEFVKKVPEQSHLVFNRLEDLLYQIDEFGQLEDFYLSVIENNPDDRQARLALAEFYERKGEIDRAISLCEEVLEKDPRSKAAKKKLVKIYHRAGRDDRAVEYALDLIEHEREEREKFVCRECGEKSDEPFWRCSNCGQWDTAVQN